MVKWHKREFDGVSFIILDSYVSTTTWNIVKRRNDKLLTLEMKSPRL